MGIFDWFKVRKEKKEKERKSSECAGHLYEDIDAGLIHTVNSASEPVDIDGKPIYNLQCSRCGSKIWGERTTSVSNPEKSEPIPRSSFGKKQKRANLDFKLTNQNPGKKKKTSKAKEDEKSKPNEHKCYKCGINASKEGYMCTPCAKETAKQMQDGTYQLRDEENENTKRIVENLMKEPEIIEKYSFDSDNEDYYQLLDKKIDSKFSGEVEHILFDGRNNNDDLVIAHIEAIQKVKGNYKNGIRDGIFQLFYTQGNLANEICYRKGVKHGTDKMYYVSGNIVNEWNYKNGVEHGPRIQYYESGKVQIHSVIKHGKIQGVQKAYHENGDSFTEDMYKDDMQDGEQKAYYENGQLQQISDYKMNQRHGITIDYYDDGQMQSLGRYKNGELIGSVIQFNKIDNKISVFNKYIEQSTSLQSTTLLKQIDIKWLKKISVFDGSTISNIDSNELIDKDGIHRLLNVPIYIKGKGDAPIVISNHDIEQAKFTIDGIVDELSEESNFELIKDKDYCYESEELIISYMMPIKSITIMLKKSQ